jgi:hypothetical protein
MRFQVFTATKFKITFLLDVVATSSVDINRSFVTPMKKGATTSSETFIFIRLNRDTSCSKGWTQLLYKDPSDVVSSVGRKKSGYKSITL